MNIEVLINKDNRLNESFVPNDLIETDKNENNFHNYKDASLKPVVSAKVLPYFLAMQAYVAKQGFNIIVDSGYRSYEYQKEVWDKNVLEKGLEETQRSVALPGASEHQSGLAIDIAYIRDGKYSDNVVEDDPEVRWLMDNAHKFGFILRYPKYSENITGYKFEPWHYRFVGIKLATVLKASNVTLEEYYLNKERINVACNYDFIEEPYMITTFQMAAAYLYVFNGKFSFLNFHHIVNTFSKKYPMVNVINIPFKTLEQLVYQLRKLDKSVLEEIAGKELISFMYSLLRNNDIPLFYQSFPHGR